MLLKRCENMFRIGHQFSWWVIDTHLVYGCFQHMKTHKMQYLSRLLIWNRSWLVVDNIEKLIQIVFLDIAFQCIFLHERMLEGRRLPMKENTAETKALLNVKEVCTYLGIGHTKARELLCNPANGFTVRIGNRLYAHKTKLDQWLLNQILWSCHRECRCGRQNL